MPRPPAACGPEAPLPLPEYGTGGKRPTPACSTPSPHCFARTRPRVRGRQRTLTANVRRSRPHDHRSACDGWRRVATANTAGVEPSRPSALRLAPSTVHRCQPRLRHAPTTGIRRTRRTEKRAADFRARAIEPSRQLSSRREEGSPKIRDRPAKKRASKGSWQGKWNRANRRSASRKRPNARTPRYQGEQVLPANTAAHQNAGRILSLRPLNLPKARIIRPYECLD